MSNGEIVDRIDRTYGQQLDFTVRPVTTQAENAVRIAGMTALIAHISDIHFGAVDEEAAARLAKQVNDNAVDGVIVTGDLTQAGRKKEFAAAAAYLQTFDAPLLAVPGNHDVPVYNLGRRFADPWSRYRQHIHDDLCPCGAFGGAFVMGLNSARRAGLSLDWSRGRLSASQISLAERSLRRSDHDLKIIALHHPVTPGPGRAGAAVIDRASRALSSFAGAGADIVLTGHAHIAQAGVHNTEQGAVIVAAAGTASSTRLRGEQPSFNMLRWNREILAIETHRYGNNGYVRERVHSFARSAIGWVSS